MQGESLRIVHLCTTSGKLLEVQGLKCIQNLASCTAITAQSIMRTIKLQGASEKLAETPRAVYY